MDRTKVRWTPVDRLLTSTRPPVTLSDMASQMQRLDPDRRRRRLRLLAALACAKAQRERILSRGVRTEQLREIVASRRRLVG